MTLVTVWVVKANLLEWGVFNWEKELVTSEPFESLILLCKFSSLKNR